MNQVPDLFLEGLKIPFSMQLYLNTVAHISKAVAECEIVSQRNRNISQYVISEICSLRILNTASARRQQHWPMM